MSKEIVPKEELAAKLLEKIQHETETHEACAELCKGRTLAVVGFHVGLQWVAKTLSEMMPEPEKNEDTANPTA